MTNRCKLELQIANHLEQHLARTEAPSLALTRVARARLMLMMRAPGSQTGAADAHDAPLGVSPWLPQNYATDSKAGVGGTGGHRLLLKQS